MQDEGQYVLSLMSDGAHRSFEAIQILAKVDSKRLRLTLKDLIDAGWLELSRAQGDDHLYVITLSGLIEEKSGKGPPPLYQP
jgi:hypothetical protein